MVRCVTLFALLMFLTGMPSASDAQEFDCNVTLNPQSLEPLTAEARENLSDFVQQLREYINNYRWTQEDFGEDRIRCNFEVFIQGSPRDNHYVAKAIIGSQRSINALNKNTSVLRLMDDKWEFDYIRFQPLTHDEYRFDPLLSFIDFYMFLILGYDFDTYENAGAKGTQYLQRALDLANKGRSAGSSSQGWEAASQITYSRTGLLEDILDSRMRPLREAVYKYHYRGLDYLHNKPDKAKQSILTALESIENLRTRINTQSLAIKIFFESKYLELAELFLDHMDPAVYAKLARIDPDHQSKYEEYSQRRR